MLGDKTSPASLRVVWVIEGGRSRTEVAALQEVARAVAEAGAQVTLVRHGLGRLSTLQVQRAVRQARPDLLISTGVTSTRHLWRLAARLACPIVCYFWPSAAVIDVHRRPKATAGSRPTPPTTQPMALPQRAVLGSEQQRQELLAVLGPARGRSGLALSRLHILPPLFDAALFATSNDEAAMVGPATPPSASRPRLGVYGAVPAQLSTWAAPAEVVPLDGTPAGAGPQASEAQRLSTCAGVLISVHDAPSAREAARHAQGALLLGRPVLLCGFGESGHELPQELQSLALPSQLLRTSRPADLARELGPFCQALATAAAAGPERPGASAPASPLLTDSAQRSLASLRQSLHPSQVLRQHTELLLEVAAHAAATRAQPTLSQRALALSLRLWRRPTRLLLRYPQVVTELRGSDLSQLITVDTLERQLQSLLGAGYQPQSLAAIADASAGRPLPAGRHFAVLFEASEAGRADVERLAAPLLARLGIPFAVLPVGKLPADPAPIFLSEQSSLGPRDRFDAQRLWLQLAQPR